MFPQAQFKTQREVARLILLSIELDTKVRGILPVNFGVCLGPTTTCHTLDEIVRKYSENRQTCSVSAYIIRSLSYSAC